METAVMSTSNGVAGHADVITLLYTMKKTLVLDIPAVWRSRALKPADVAKCLYGLPSYIHFPSLTESNIWEHFAIRLHRFPIGNCFRLI